MWGRGKRVVASLLGASCLCCGCHTAALNGRGEALAPRFGLSGPPAQTEPPLTADDTTPRRGATPTAFDRDDEPDLRSTSREGLLKRMIVGKEADPPRKSLPVHEGGAELGGEDAFDF